MSARLARALVGAAVLLVCALTREAHAQPLTSFITFYTLSGPTRWGGWGVPAGPGVLACFGIAPRSHVRFWDGREGWCWDTIGSPQAAVHIDIWMPDWDTGQAQVVGQYGYWTEVEVID